MLGMAVACGGARARVPSALAADVPSGLRSALAARWRGAAIPEPGQVVGTPCAEPVGDATSPILHGDFNGDGLEDLAVRVIAADGPHLAVGIALLGGRYHVVEVSQGADSTGGPLTIGRRGTAYRLENIAVDSYFGLDTLLERGCDKTRTAYFWTGDSFTPGRLAN